MNYKEIRPWGEFENLLDNNLCKVKQITIKPGQAPSYQYHFKRSEVWTIIQGEGELKLNDTIIPVSKGYTYYIEKEVKHQIKNIGVEDLIFIEIQLGEYFGEDDIVRLEDNYGRI
jgi:mannose-6-phosphate isomerase-like protein (cupin superfamily)